MKKILLSSLAAGLLLVGCGEVEPSYVDVTGANKAPLSLGIDANDFSKAATDMVEDLLSSGALNKPGGGRYVVAISRIKNDTTQRIDTDMLIKKIRVAMLKSGKAVVTTAVSAGGAEDEMSYQVRDELRGNDEFNQKNVPGKNSLIAPDMSLSGKIIEKTTRVSKDKQVVEYWFQLSLTDIKSGLAFWEQEVVVGKSGSAKSVNW